MLRPLLTVVLAVLVLGIGTGCSNGGSGPTSAVSGACSTGAGAFCLAACNLGCSPNGGCSITDIAPNQPIEFRFSQVIDPSTVDSSSISIRTSSGQEPIGALVVEGDKVTFRPEVRFVQGATFFGFTTNETYTITVAGGNSPNAIASTSGDRLGDRFVCTLRVTLDVVDVDPRAPFATLVSPTTTSLASRDSIFTLEFNEIIDFAPFFNVAPEDQPIRYRVRRNLTTGGQRECDASSASIPLSGTPRLSNDLQSGRSIATFTPFETLPGDTCIEIEVTNLVRDLSGQRAPRSFFRITLAADSLQARVTEFDFQDDLLLDANSSGGAWGGTEATFAQVGGDGRHGVFNFEDGERDPATGFYDFSTDDQEITAYPFTAEALAVGLPRITDGCFYFSRMEIPVGVTVRFLGSNPAKIFVRGECSILGSLIVNGEGTPDGHNGAMSSAGQPGGRGGAGGGAGGAGAFKGTNDGNPNQPAFNNFFGFDGGNIVVPMGHAYATQIGGTAGSGGSIHPPGNDLAVVTANPPPAFFPSQTDYIGGYGGGGGFVTPGGAGTVVSAQSALSTGNSPDFRGGDAAGGSEFTPFVTLGRPAGVRSIDFFLVGGAGGGGGGTHPFISSLLLPSYWSGGGGAGGGGALGLFVGNSLSIEATGSLEARGGAAGSHSPVTLTPSVGFAPAGGGGSGGSVLVQVQNSLSVLGAIDVRGGSGGMDLVDPNGPCVPGVPCIGYLEANGGDGGEGFLRVEQVGAVPSLPLLANAQPAATAVNVGELEDPNELSGFMSLFVSTNEVFSPIFSRYVIEADVDGVARTFSDDPDIGPSAVDGAPIRFYVQGSDIDTLTGQPPIGSTPSPWRQFVGFSPNGEPTLNSDAPLGFRFTLIRDSRVSSNVVVRSVRIEYQS